MKLILMTVFLMCTTEIINANQNDDLSHSADKQSVEPSEAGVTENLVLATKGFLNKAKKFVVTLKRPAKTSYTLPKRTSKKSFATKFEVKYNAVKGNIGVFPVVSTKRPRLMETRRFTSKPHLVDRAQKLEERNNFSKKRTLNKINMFKAEDKTVETIDTVPVPFKVKESESLEERFENFTNIDIPDESGSDESIETGKPLLQRLMKGAASYKVTTIAPAPYTNGVKNYKIKDLLKDEKYMPKIDRQKMIPVLSLQKDQNIPNKDSITLKTSQVIAPSNVASSIKTTDYLLEEKADQEEFIFIKENKHKPTTSSPEDDEIVTMDPIYNIDARHERSVNIIEEERVATTSGTKFPAKDWSMGLELTYKNIHT